jgi:AraC family transcriptional regulator, ethanolamine operon transcriptional activator
MVSASIEFPQRAKPRRGDDVALLQQRVTVLEIRDPIIAEEEIEVINQNLVQLRSEALQARRVVVRLETTALIYQSTNLALRTRSTFSQGLVGFVAFGPQAAGTINGLLFRPNLMVMATAGTEGRFVVEGGYESISVGIPPASLEAHLRVRRQWKLLEPQRPLQLLVCDETKAHALFSFGKRLADTAMAFQDLFNEDKKMRAAAEVELVEMLLDAISSSQNYIITRSDETHQARSHVVKLAEEYALAQTDIPLRVTDLCKAAAVCERALEYAFKDVLGMSPMSYLQRLRLHRVRQALRAGTHATTTVSAEALKWGFWHFGDFSKAYKNCFGELPSDTLRRVPSKSPRVKMAAIDR